MFSIFGVLSVILLLEAILTLSKVIRFRNFFIRDISVAVDHLPKVALLAPCKGLDRGMEENIRSWFKLDYPDFKIFFIVDSDQDPALSLVRKFRQAEVMIAGNAVDCGQKVHNLRYAISRIPPGYEVFVFVDSDCCVKNDWLRNLVRELCGDPENAVTGYRWFTNTANFGSIVRSAWNSSVLSLYQEKGKDNFAWGGATAILRTTFESSRILEFWKGSISDDYSLTNAMKSSGRMVNFVPGALAFTRDSVSFGEFLKWAFRQLLITRIYYPKLWAAAFVFHCAWFFWIVSGLFFPLYFLPAFILVQFIQSIKADLRWQCIHRTGETSTRQRIYFWLLGPVLGFCNFLLTLSTIFTRKITWRNVEYILLSRDRLIVHQR